MNFFKKHLFFLSVLLILFVLQIFIANKALADECPAGTSWICDVYLVRPNYLCSVGFCDSRTWSVGLPCSAFPNNSSFPLYGSFCSDAVNHVFCTNGAAYNVPCGGWCGNSSQCISGLNCRSNTCVNSVCPTSSNCICPACTPINGGWTSWDWSSWYDIGSCGTYQSGKQLQQRDATRTCTNPTPSCGGANCSGSSSTSETQYITCCTPINGGWTSWNWGSWYNVGSCGTYQSCEQKLQRDATRTCTNPTPSCGGTDCSGSSSTSEENFIACGVINGDWSAWSGWSSVGSCGTYQPCEQRQGRTRDCNNPPPSCGGADCSGSSEETQDIACGLVNGVCGSSDGSSFYTKPTTNLCSVGIASSVSGSGPWSWTCPGLCEGTTGSCSANLKVDGSCGSADDGVFPSQPTTNLCSAGTPSSVSGTSGPCSWTCDGLYGGIPDDCNAYIDNIKPTIDYFKVNDKIYGQEAIVNDGALVIVSWKTSDDRSGVNRVEIWRQDITASGSWQKVYETASAQNQWTDATVADNHDYWYGIHVADNIGNLIVGSSHSPVRDPIKAIINTSPTVLNMTAPNWSFNESCSLGAKKAILRWTHNDSSGESGTAYRLILSTTDNPSSPTEFDTGKCTGYSASPSKCKIDVSPISYQYTLENTELEYNTPYYWWVQTWDEHGQPSTLTQYNTATDTDNPDGNPLTFTTYKHEFPIVDFGWFPVSPSKDEEIQFTDASKIYSDAERFSNPSPCGNCSWLWSSSDAGISNQTAANPIITFNSSGDDQLVELQTTDSDGYSCSHPEYIDVNVALPGWSEVK